MVVAGAIILTVRPHREVDRVVTCVSAEAGRLDVVARGTRKASSKLAASLEPYARVRAEVVAGRTWPTLIHVDVEDARTRLRSRLGGLIQAGFVAGLAEALLRPEDPNPRLAALVERELARIDRSATHEVRPADALALALFIIRALAAAGWHPDLARCARCRRALGSGPAVFEAHPFGLVHPREAAHQTGPRLSHATRRYLATRLRRITNRPALVGRLVARELGAFSAAVPTAVLEQPLPAARFLRALARPAASLVR